MKICTSNKLIFKVILYVIPGMAIQANLQGRRDWVRTGGHREAYHEHGWHQGQSWHPQEQAGLCMGATPLLQTLPLSSQENTNSPLPLKIPWRNHFLPRRIFSRKLPTLAWGVGELVGGANDLAIADLMNSWWGANFSCWALLLDLGLSKCKDWSTGRWQTLSVPSEEYEA